MQNHTNHGALKAVLLLVPFFLSPLYSGILIVLMWMLSIGISSKYSQQARDVIIGGISAFSCYMLSNTNTAYQHTYVMIAIAALLWWVFRLPPVMTQEIEQLPPKCTEDVKTTYSGTEVVDAEYWDPEREQWRLPQATNNWRHEIGRKNDKTALPY